MRTPPSAELTTALDVLAAPQRRYLLATLLERADTSSTDRPSTSERLSVETLATEVATIEHGCPIVTDEQCERVHIELVHVHVPRLADAELLSRHDDGDATTVALTDHPVLESAWVRSLLDDPTGETLPVDEGTFDRTLEALRSPRRRTVCAALARRRGTVSVTDLAAAVVAREGGDETRLVDVTESACTDVATSLVHEHLPILSNAGLVECDDEAEEVVLATDAPQWRIDWMTEGPLADVAAFVEATATEAPDATATATDVPDATATDALATSKPADDESAADTPVATATAADGDRMLWTLARPRAGRATGDESSSSRDVTSPPDESSTATGPPDGPPT
ncbi:hypothetical protein HYG81_13005 [Natrinema zhouii]|uniref:DUF7344 domain-containing protein n=1 Tax=Natrinema zhouii TaxID=1710539 RepID=A0A7D6GJE5_9EURY|nr:hypothetical protein [Natrinema zhouii]QLK25020.1 hypothetical protein HYG81_13005 [Natrinema zhouii]